MLNTVHCVLVTCFDICSYSVSQAASDSSGVACLKALKNTSHQQARQALKNTSHQQAIVYPHRETEQIQLQFDGSFLPLLPTPCRLFCRLFVFILLLLHSFFFLK